MTCWFLMTVRGSSGFIVNDEKPLDYSVRHAPACPRTRTDTGRPRSQFGILGYHDKLPLVDRQTHGSPFWSSGHCQERLWINALCIKGTHNQQTRPCWRKGPLMSGYNVADLPHLCKGWEGWALRMGQVEFVEFSVMMMSLKNFETSIPGTIRQSPRTHLRPLRICQHTCFPCLDLHM